MGRTRGMIAPRRRRPAPWAWRALGLAAALVAAGCGAGNDDDATPAGSPTEATDSPPTPAGETTFIVDIEGRGDFSSIQEAVSWVPDGSRLVLHEGVYPEAVDLGSKALVLVGDGVPGRVIIDASACRGPRCSALIVAGGQGPSTQIRGLTLTGGSGSACDDGLTNTGASRCGGGLAISAASPTLEGIIVAGNSADRGAGLWIFGPSNVTAHALQVTGGVADEGAGIYLRGGTLSLSHARIHGNGDPARGQGGGLYIQSANASLSNVLVVNNRAASGAGIGASSAHVDMTAVTLADNLATYDGGGLFLVGGSQITAEAAILSGNTAGRQGSQVNFNCDGCGLSLAWSVVFDPEDAYGGGTDGKLTLGEGMIDLDPRFIGSGDYRLRPVSPAVDTGPPEAQDPDGSAADIGAYALPAADGFDLDGDTSAEGWRLGLGADGWDCDDLDPSQRPGLLEVCDGRDNDCDGELMPGEEDQDGDGWYTCETTPEDPDLLDCDDLDATVHPEGQETINDGDGKDSDCDGVIDEGTLGGDSDGDGYCQGLGGVSQCACIQIEDYPADHCESPVAAGPAPTACSVPGLLPGDCDDANPRRAPGLPEVCDGEDNDCTCTLPRVEHDSDTDGFVICDTVVGAEVSGGDTDDANNTIYPGASEVGPNGPDGLDNDGDDVVDEGTRVFDDDGDGYCEEGACRGDALPGDCDDGAACAPEDETCLELARAIHPGAHEDCDGLDTDCDGVVPDDEQDEDQDGWRGCNGDCDDTVAWVNPAAVDEPRNGIDEDCSGSDRGAVGIGLGDEDPAERVALSCAQAPGGGRVGWGWALLLGLGLWLRRRGRAAAAIPLAVGAAALAGCLGADSSIEVANTPTLADSTQAPDDSTPSAAPTSAPSPSEEPTGVDATPTESGPEVFIVNPAGGGDFSDLQEAVDRVPRGSIIRVMEGVYPGPLDLGITTVRIEAIGAPERTIIDASGCEGSQCSAVIIAGGQGSGLSLSGFTVTGGAGRPCPGDAASRCGGGLFVAGASPTLDRLTVIGNQADRGGGLYLTGESLGRTASLSNLKILGNHASRGAGAAISGGSWALDRVWIAENDASLRGGALDVGGGEVQLTSAILAENEGAIGGGMSVAGATVTVSFAVLSRNVAASGGGLSLGDGGIVTAEGVIFHRDEADQGPEINAGCASCAATLRYSTVDSEGSPWGGDLGALILDDASVTEADPRFVADGDYRLATGSPCIDAGPPDARYRDPDGTRADQGAFAAASAAAWDLDGDGAYRLWSDEGGEDPPAPWDCDDADPLRAPGKAEACDGIDNDCDGEPAAAEVDADGDGHRLCDVVDGEPAPDCDDANPAAYPGAEEGEEGDGADNDCDGQADEATTGADDDGDGYCEGYGDEPTCADGSLPGDCDDADDSRRPGVEETCDGVDTDCDGVRPEGEADRDLDGWRPCEGDTDDLNNTVHPGASETPGGVGDGLDNDGDGRVDEGTTQFDDDGDGFCEQGPCIGHLPDGDCDDGASCPEGDATCLALAVATHPDQPEVCDGADNDCDGQRLVGEQDRDGDGYLVCAGDCDDGAASTYPGARDEPGNGVDEDCDGWDKGVVGFGGDRDPDRLALSCATSAGAGRGGWALLLLGLATRPLRGRRRCRTSASGAAARSGS